MAQAASAAAPDSGPPRSSPGSQITIVRCSFWLTLIRLGHPTQYSTCMSPWRGHVIRPFCVSNRISMGSMSSS